MKKKIIIICICILAVASGAYTAYYLNNMWDKPQNSIEETENYTENNTVIVTDEIQEIVNETIEAVENGEDLSTTEEITSTEENEKELEEEIDAQVEQENIAYNRR